MTPFSQKILSFALSLALSAFVCRAQSDAPRLSGMSMSRGVEYLLSGNNEAASLCFRQALAEDPSNDAAHYYLGLSAAQSNDADTALSEFECAYRMDSTNVWYAKRYATVSAAVGKTEDARRVYETLLQAHGSDLETMYALSEMYMDAEQFGKASAVLDKIDALQGVTDYSRVVRFEMKRMQGDVQGYFAGMNSYFSDPMVYPQTKKHLFEQQLRSGDPRFNYNHLKDYDDLIQSCLDVHPGDTLITHLAAAYYFSSQNADKMIALYEANPYDIKLLASAIYVNQAAGSYDQAIRCCRQWKRLSADNPMELSEAWTVEGDCWQAMGKSSKSDACYEKAIKLNPDNIVAMNNYAYHLSCSGRHLKRSMQMSAKVIEKEPDNATYLDTYAWILYKMGAYNEAKNVFKRIMALGGKNSVEILEHYAAVLEKLGDATLAEKYRTEAQMKKNEGKK